MIDDELGRLQRIDLLRIATHHPHGIAHGRQIDDCRHTGEVLEQNPGRHERDLDRWLCLRIPGCHGFDILCRDRRAILATQQILEQNP